MESPKIKTSGNAGSGTIPHGPRASAGGVNGSPPGPGGLAPKSGALNSQIQTQNFTMACIADFNDRTPPILAPPAPDLENFLALPEFSVFFENNERNP
ncbi:MAG: hypothetical protein ACO3JG_10065 [Luteolibacter sp.]